MNQKIEFVLKAVNHPNFSDLCEEYGISRKTGYKWRNRLLSDGISGLEERSRRPKSHRKQLTEEVVCQIVKLKIKYPHWGPRKIRELYLRRHGGKGPSESSFKRVLKKAGLVVPRKRRKSADTGRLAAGRKAAAQNDIWTIDFKGWWHGNNGRRVEPLTVRDEFSRMILAAELTTNARTETVQKSLEKLFKRHGLPGAIRSDNGPPFASRRALLGLSRLSAWLLALGIDFRPPDPG